MSLLIIYAALQINVPKFHYTYRKLKKYESVGIFPCQALGTKYCKSLPSQENTNIRASSAVWTHNSSVGEPKVVGVLNWWITIFLNICLAATVGIWQVLSFTAGMLWLWIWLPLTEWICICAFLCALWWAFLLSKMSYQMCIKIHTFRIAFVTCQRASLIKYPRSMKL